MDEDVDKIFKHRLTIVNNLDNLVKFANSKKKSKSIGQMSLFADQEEEIRPEIIEFKGNISKFEMALKETDLIGLPITYDYMNKYYLHYKTYITHTIPQINELTEGVKGIITIGRISKIEYRTSAMGNDYVKIFVSDKGDEIMIYVTGAVYKRYIGFFKKDDIYLLQINKDAERGNLSLSLAELANNVNPFDKITGIELFVKNIRYVIKVRDYIFKNMIGNNLNLFFNVNSDQIKAPYKININIENLLYLEKMCEINVIKKQWHE